MINVLDSIQTLHDLDDIESIVALFGQSSIKADPRRTQVNNSTYMRMESAIEQSLADAWGIGVDMVRLRIEQIINERGSGSNLSELQVEHVVIQELGSELIKDPKLLQRLSAAATEIPLFGKLEVSNLTGGYPRTSFYDRKISDWFRGNVLYFAGRYVQLEHLSDDRGGQISIAKRIGTIVSKLDIEQGLGLREQGRAVNAVITDELGYKKLGKYYFEVVASNTAMYGRRFGQITQMVAENILTETFRALGDERTCDICGRLDGTTWIVSRQLENMNKIMDVREPDDIRRVSPWIQWDANSRWTNDGKEQIGQAYIKYPGGDKQYMGTGLTDTSKLQGLGIGVGQIHGGCRCVRLPGGDTRNVMVSYPQSV